MAIVSMDMGNLTLEVNILKNKLAIGDKEKAVLHEEIDKERDFQKGYQHMWKFGGRIGQRLRKRLKCSLKNYKMKMRSSKVA
jgi:hypothetical protein